MCASVGWLIRKTDDCRMLCPTIGDLDSDETQGMGIITIPNSSVVNVERLSEVPSSSNPSDGQPSAHDEADALASSLDRLKKVSGN